MIIGREIINGLCEFSRMASDLGDAAQESGGLDSPPDCQ